MTPEISVREVTKAYDERAASTLALDRVSLDVHRAEVMLLMGPSGSGKTTLLSIMGGILRPTSGSVKIAGREIGSLGESELPAVRLNQIGFVFQAFNLFPNLSAGENIELALDLKHIRGAEARRRAAALLDLVGLAHRYRDFPANLSGGQKQRVAIARALAHDPAVVLADEPTAALDSESGRSVMELLRGLAHDRGRAVVIVTHDTRAVAYADRIVRIQDGRIADNCPEEVACLA